MAVNPDEKPACPHPVSSGVYLTTAYTPHVHQVETLQVAVHMFICRDCGETYHVNQPIPRGFLADGSLTPGMEEEIRSIKQETIVKQRVAQAVEQEKLKAEHAKRGQLTQEFLDGQRQGASSTQSGESTRGEATNGGGNKHPSQEELDQGFGSA